MNDNTTDLTLNMVNERNEQKDSSNSAETLGDSTNDSHPFPRSAKTGLTDSGAKRKIKVSYGVRPVPDSARTKSYDELLNMPTRAEKTPEQNIEFAKRHPIAFIAICGVIFVAGMWLWGFLDAASSVKKGMNLLDYNQKKNNMNFISRSGMDFYLSKFTNFDSRQQELQDSRQSRFEVQHDRLPEHRLRPSLR